MLRAEEGKQKPGGRELAIEMRTLSAVAPPWPPRLRLVGGETKLEAAGAEAAARHAELPTMKAVGFIVNPMQGERKCPVAMAPLRGPVQMLFGLRGGAAGAHLAARAPPVAWRRDPRAPLVDLAAGEARVL